MQYYLKNVDETLSEVKSGIGGLTSAEAGERLARDGKTSWQRPRKIHC